MTAMKDFKWRQGSQIKIPAKDAGERLEWLKQKHGGNVTPVDVLADARSPQSPLHAAFEWSDGKAAEQFRLQQAGQIIRSLVIEVRIRQDKPKTKMRAFANVRTASEESVFVDLPTAISTPSMRGQIVEKAYLELESWVHRYQQYPELKKEVDAVEHLLRFRAKKAA